MKKISKMLTLITVLLLAIALVFTGCGSKGGNEPEESGQNPAMNFVGNYACDRANIFIEADGEDGMIATVTWGSSVSENSTWTMSGKFEAEELQMMYNDCVRTDYVYEESGDVKSQEEVYVNGHGVLKFTEGDPITLAWTDDQEHMADDMVFEYVGVAPEEGEVGMPNPWSDVNSAEEAAQGAGLEFFEPPEGVVISLGEVGVEQYRCMKGLAEAVVEFPAVEMTIRKGNDKSLEMADGDISGDYGEYANTWTQNIKGLEVTCYGNREGEATKTIWTVDDIDYSICVQGLGGDEDYGLSPDDLNSLINAFQ